MTDAQPTTSRAPVPQVPSAAAVKAAKRTGSNIIVSTRQKGNPVLDHVKQSWEYGDIVADYQVGATTGVLYLSLKYHHLHPQYIPDRFEKLGRSYDLRILLILCDVTEHQNSIKELTKACLLNQMTVMIAWSYVPTSSKLPQLTEARSGLKRRGNTLEPTSNTSSNPTI
ncbi:ssDNA endonuclease and repair protein rad10 [Ceratobasidium sp. 394]|nr:ssDNA endonuclease and repair protein rad10 [Ceratobasidium sp. 394]